MGERVRGQRLEQPRPGHAVGHRKRLARGPPQRSTIGQHRQRQLVVGRGPGPTGAVARQSPARRRRNAASAGVQRRQPRRRRRHAARPARRAGVEARVSSRRAWLPTVTQTMPSAGSSARGSASSSAREVERIDERRQHARELQRRARWSGAGPASDPAAGRPPPPAHRCPRARSITRRAPNHERGWAANRSASSSTPTSLPALADHRRVADPALEHLVQDLAAEAVRGDREHRRASWPSRPARPPDGRRPAPAYAGHGR